MNNFIFNIFIIFISHHYYYSNKELIELDFERVDLSDLNVYPFGLETNRDKYGINAEIVTWDGNRVLRLTSYPGDQVAMTCGCGRDRSYECCNCRDRCELKIFKGDTKGSYFYEWSFFIPVQEFNLKENRTGFCDPKSRPTHIINQWHQLTKYNSGQRIKYFGDEHGENGLNDRIKGQPPIIFSLKSNDFSQQIFDLNIYYGRFYKNSKNDRVRERLPLNGVISMGKWTKIRQEIRWSGDNDGFMKLWFNNYPIVLDSQTKSLVIGSIEENPFSFKGPNLYQDIYGNNMPNYLKIGHYRARMEISSTVLLDSIKIGKL